MKVRDHLENRHRWEENVRMEKECEKLWIGFMWLRMGTRGRL
jgi:hypothetical protein